MNGSSQPDGSPSDAKLTPPAGPLQYLSRGYQGAVFLSGTGPDRTVIKKATGGFLGRSLRRAMLRREFAAYQRIAGVGGVPRCIELRKDGSLILQFIDGVVLCETAPELRDRGAFFAELLQIILALHGAGVAHADLKRRGNILISRDGRPWLVDFGSAVVFRANSGLLNGWLFRLACRMDLNAWIKLKYRRRYAEIEPADRMYYAPTFIEASARVIRNIWRKLTARQLRKAWRRRRAGR